MGYHTNFSGILKFTKELTVPQLTKLQTYLGEDCRDHPEWNAPKLFTWIDLELSQDNSGLEWDGSDNTYDMVEKINFIIDKMREEYPEFGLEGIMSASGDDSDDHWEIAMIEGKAVGRNTYIVSETIICPHCGKPINTRDL